MAKQRGQPEIDNQQGYNLVYLKPIKYIKLSRQLQFDIIIESSTRSFKRNAKLTSIGKRNCMTSSTESSCKTQ